MVVHAEETATRRTALRAAAATLGLLLAFTGSAPLRADAFADHLAEGNRLYVQGDFVRAEESYLQARNEQPETAAPLFNIANTYFARQDYERSVERYREALAFVRDDRALEVDVRYNMATAQVRQSELTIEDVTSPEKVQTGLDLLQQAVAGYRDVLEIAPEHADARHNLAVVQLRVKKLLDDLKRLQEEAAKDAGDQGDSPTEILRQLIAEEKEQITQTQKALASAGERHGVLGFAARAKQLRAGLTALEGQAPDEAMAGKRAVVEGLRALEEDPALVVGGAEVSEARKALEAADAAAASTSREFAEGSTALDDAVKRLETAFEAVSSLVGETAGSGAKAQEATQQKALGLVGGLRQAASGETPPPAAGGSGHPQPAQPPAPPPPPEVAARLETVATLTEEAGGFMSAAVQALTEGQGLAGEDKDSQDLAGELTDVLGSAEGAQKEALAKLEEALAEAEKLPGQPPPPQQQGQNQEQQGEEGDQGEQKEDEEQEDQGEGDQQEQDRNQEPPPEDGGEQGEGEEGEQDGEQEPRGEGEREQELSEEEAERLLRRFLENDADRKRERDERERARRGRGRIRTLEKDW